VSVQEKTNHIQQNSINQFIHLMTKKMSQLEKHSRGEIHIHYQPQLKHRKKLKLSIAIYPYPKVYLEDRSVYCNQQKLDLKGKEQILKMFSIFLATKGYRLGRQKLIESIYNTPDYHSVSERYLVSMHHSIVKLLSRARSISNQFLGENGLYEWFTYINKSQEWQLYRLNIQKKSFQNFN